MGAYKVLYSNNKIHDGLVSNKQFGFNIFKLFILEIVHYGDLTNFVYKFVAGSCLLWSSIIMVMFKLKRCVAPSRDEWEKQKEKDEVQKQPLILDDLGSTKEKVPMLAEDIVVCV